jgi:peptidoglycan/xylan/chitin deacetylase (PgdA/CDA1 family)
MYHSKLLELLSIERTPDKSYLHLRLSFIEPVEFLWKIDHETADTLIAVTSSEGSYKYRLALQSSWNSTQKKNLSFITRTFLDQSEKIYFSCSEEYINGINAIKSVELNSDIYALPNVSINIPQIKEPEPEQEPVKVNPVRSKPNYSWLKFAMVGAIFITVLSFGYSNLSNLKKTEIKNKTVVNAQGLSKEAEVLPKEKEIKTTSPTQSTIPFVELNEKITYSIPKGSVALTFDDGPSKYTKEIVDILKTHQAGGTFFFIGVNITKHKDMVRYVKSNDYSIGGHSMHHSNMTDLNYEKQEKEILQTKQLLEDITSDNVELFRPPFGAMNEITMDVMNKYGSKTVLWNKDPEDWNSKNSDEIIEYVLNSKASGSIILLHESQTVVDALPIIIAELQQQGLQIVTLK